MACSAQDGNGRFCDIHGMSQSREYAAWANMLYRCNNKNAPQYNRYGGRGIKVCQEWKDFPIFLKDMGNRPSEEHSIDRIDVNGDYEPENCRWADIKTQAKNRRSTRFYLYDGNRLSASEIIEKYQLNKQRVLSRLRRGWSIKDAVETDSKRRNKKRTECLS